MINILQIINQNNAKLLSLAKTDEEKELIEQNIELLALIIDDNLLFYKESDK